MYQSTPNVIVIVCNTQSIYLCFYGHFPGGRGLAGTRMSPFWILLVLGMMEMVVTTGAIRGAKLQPNHHQQTNIQCFYRPDALPVAQPTVSEHWRESLCIEYYTEKK